ncbi:S-layer homology domain-containing protein [Paenibacillus mesophilus]|uniref:S-layer homology domain-containing protein n=1 Tax=Paenibacillus mesophilus TaxID=2582849 RepID=UPI00110DAF99|nr:S-layer homology domain-containing protein [Paenibacillus mesophilus]TMV47159.1 S-layer homology domain-containing protein [Paenibacillus mesophilus]
MSMKSLQIKLNSQTSNDDNRGGEKKVMKKSLSVLVASAMVSSIFASVAFAADLTTQQKLDELIKLGIFDKDGTGNGSELNANMSREQLAKILAKLKDLKEVTGTSYTDVAADRWSAGFIQAVSKATPMLMDGKATGIFDPAGNVTLEELAAVAVRALGLQQNTTATVKGNVSDWAKGYVAAAIANGLLSEKTDYTKPAIRSELVEASYSAQQAIAASQKPAKASVKSAKATGVSKIEVALDRDVDDKVAKLSVKKGSVEIAIASTTWSTDKKTATLTLKDAKISEGEYTVTLGGLAAADIGTASATFKGENEKVTKLEFATTSDTIAQSTKARIQFRAVNQYNEASALSAGNFTATTPGFNNSGITKDDKNNFILTIDTMYRPGSTTEKHNPGTAIVPVYIYENDTRFSVQQNFKLGSEPFVTKMELGDVKYPSGKTSITSSGEYATIPVTIYDQFGNPMAYDSQTTWTYNKYTIPYSDKVDVKFEDFDNDNFGEVRVTLSGRAEKSEDYNVTLQIGGANNSKTVKVASVKLATKIVFGNESDSLNEGDVRDVYIPIIAYDEAGNELTADEIVDDENYNRIKIDASNVKGTGAGEKVVIEKSGPYKGQLHISSVEAKAGSYAFISAYLDSRTGNNSYITKNIPISRARTPDKISVVTANAPKSAGGASNFKLVVLDQNGKQLDNVGTVSENGQNVTYSVYVDYKFTDKNGNVITDTNVNNIRVTRLDRLGKASDQFVNAGNIPSADARTYKDSLANFNTTYQFLRNNTTNAALANGRGEKVEYKAQLRRSLDGGVTNTVISESIRTFTLIDYDTADLTYTVTKPATLYATKDSPVLDSTQATTTGIQDRLPSVTAKDSAGDNVILPASGIFSVTSSVYSVAQASTAGVLGYTPGKTILTVGYKTLKKEDRVVNNLEVEVKGDVPFVNAVTSDSTVSISKGEKYNTGATGGGTEYTKAWQFMNLKVADQYGISYAEDNISAYDKITGVIYTITPSDPAKTTGLSISNVSSDTVKKGDITGLGGLSVGTHYFTITATSGGKSASTYVKYTVPAPVTP